MDQEEIYDGDFSDLQDGDELDGDDEGQEEYSYSDLEDDPEDLEAEEGPAEQPAKQPRRAADPETESVEITEKFFEKLKGQLLQNPGFGPLKVFLRVFLDLINEDSTANKRKRTYLVTDLLLMNSIIRFGIEEFPRILVKASGLTVSEQETSFKKPRNEVLVLTLCNNLVKFLAQQNTSEMITYISQHIRKNLTLFRASLRKSLKLVLVCLQNWGGSDEIECKLESLLILKEVCSFVDNSHYEKILKKAFLTFVEHCKLVSWRNYDLVSFMTNGMVELFRVKPEISYILVFNVLQSIANRTKALLTSNDSEKIKKLFNWKTLNTLRFCSKTVAQLYRESADYPQLAPPLIDLLKALTILYPAHTYAPFRLHVLQLLLNVSQTTGFCVAVLPVFTSLLKIHPEKHHKNAIQHPVDFDIAIKMDKSKGMDEKLLGRILELLCFWISTREDKKGYPEWSVVLERILNAIRKTTEDKDVREGLRSIVQDLREGRKQTVLGRKGLRALQEKDPKAKAVNSKLALKQKVLAAKQAKKPPLALRMRQEYEKRRVARETLIKLKVSAEKEEEDDVDEQELEAGDSDDQQ